MIALDLFCGAGGASEGLFRAGFQVDGVDLSPQPHYPFNFFETDALNFSLGDYDFYWASPPCQRYTQMLNHGLTKRDKHPDLIEPIRQRLIKTGKPYVIENVLGAPIRRDLMLCGEMFGLRVMRHRFFECSFPVVQPYHPQHNKQGARRKEDDGGYYLRVYGHETGKREWGEAMGIDWMRSPELAQAIPPAYSEYIGRQFIGS